MSRRRRTKKKLQNRKPKPVVEDTRWYTIRCIVDKRTIRGELEYLVDWEDDIETGESYGATWVKGCDVTEAAKREWECTKESKQSEKPIAAPHPQLDNVNNNNSNDNNQQPGATRPRSKRSRLSTRETVGEDNEYEDKDEESRGKRVRSDFDPSPSAEPAPSFTSGSSVEAVEEHWIGEPNAQISVEILRIPGLGPSEYRTVYGGPLTAFSCPISELESQDQRIALASNSRQRPIPDSQEQSSLELRTQQDELPAAASPLPSTMDWTCHSSFGQNHLDLSPEQPFGGSTEGDSEVRSRQPSPFKSHGGHCQELPNEGRVEMSTDSEHSKTSKRLARKELPFQSDSSGTGGVQDTDSEAELAKAADANCQHKIDPQLRPNSRVSQAAQAAVQNFVVPSKQGSDISTTTVFNKVISDTNSLSSIRESFSGIASSSSLNGGICNNDPQVMSKFIKLVLHH